MEYRNLNLTLDEIDLIAEALDTVYYRRLKKAQSPRNAKAIEELRFCQVLTQKLLALKKYDQEEIAPDIGGSQLHGEEAKGTAGS